MPSSKKSGDRHSHSAGRSAPMCENDCSPQRPTSSPSADTRRPSSPTLPIGPGSRRGRVFQLRFQAGLFAELLAQRSLDLAARVLAHVSDLDPQAAAGAGGGEIASWVVAEPRWPLLTVEFGILAGRDPVIAERYRTDRRALRSELERLIADRAVQWGVGRRSMLDASRCPWLR